MFLFWRENIRREKIQNIIHEKYVDFFSYGILRKEYSVTDIPKVGGDLYIHSKPLRYVDNEDVDLNAVTDINMLRLSNTAFIASYIKLGRVLMLPIIEEYCTLNI